MIQLLTTPLIVIGIACFCQPVAGQVNLNAPGNLKDSDSPQQAATLQFRANRFRTDEEHFISEPQGRFSLISHLSKREEDTHPGPFRTAGYSKSIDHDSAKTTDSNYEQVLNEPALAFEIDYENVVQESKLVQPELSKVISSTRDKPARKRPARSDSKSKAAPSSFNSTFIAKVAFSILGLAAVLMMLIWQLKVRLFGRSRKRARKRTADSKHSRRTRRPRRPLKEWL